MRAGLSRFSSVLTRCGAVALAGLLAAGCAASSSSSTPHSHTADAVTVPASALGQPGTIRYCSDISGPPTEFYSNGQTPTGSDIDLGNAIAHELGLTPQWINTAFAGIIPALQAGHCDAILSQLFDKPARRAVVDFVDYMNSSEAVMVRAGNPGHVTGLAGLCGLNVATETGTTIADYLTTQTKTCVADGKKPISVATFLRDSDAANQLALGHVAAYGTTMETAAYDMTKNPGSYQIAGPPFGQILTGIGTVKHDKALHDAIAAAFGAIVKDGTYRQIMTKWNLGPDMLTQG